MIIFVDCPLFFMTHGHMIHDHMKWVIETSHGTICVDITTDRNVADPDLAVIVMDTTTPKYEIYRRGRSWRCPVYTIGIMPTRGVPTLPGRLENMTDDELNVHASHAFDHVQYGNDLVLVPIISHIIYNLFSPASHILAASILDAAGVIIFRTQQPHE
jgi:hypothetical protein